MKENWTYKKLGEVCTIVGGSTPKTSEKEFWDGPYFWVTPADLDGSMYQGATPRTITQKAVDKTNLSLLPVGTVLLSSRAPIGKVAITTVPMYCNQGFKNIICPDCINNEFVYWFLKGKTEYLNSLGTGATFKEISKKTTESISIPVPPLEEQERIVEELDLLSGVIEKQKQQLKELDTLAQSIFYNTFGDPITNEKNWPVKKLKDAVDETCSCSYGIVQPGDHILDGVPVIRPVDLTDTFVTLKGLKKTTKAISDSYSRTILKGHEILLCVRGTTGLVAIASNDLIGCNTTRGIVPLRCGCNVNYNFLYYIFKSKEMNQYIQERTYGATLKQINISSVKDIPVILPPLSLQEEFAEKIEMIEKQKEAIGKSIKETQLLFDYTMDKYFG